jgi:ABC-type Na+ transport system ATPase subunit NatA
MNTTIKTSSKNQLDQIRRFVKRNNIYNTITEENNLYLIKLFGLKASEIEKFIKDFTKANHLTKIQQQESQALAA